MLDETFSRPYRLHYSVRGPEWAFGVPQGDLHALEDVMVRCAQFWNGAGSLIVPFTRDGRISEGLAQLLEVRQVEHCFLHEGLTARARETASARFEHTSRLYDGFDAAEIHPVFNAHRPAENEPMPPLLVPRFSSRKLRRAVLACWGYWPGPPRR